jgi:hypothetical protein
VFFGPSHERVASRRFHDLIVLVVLFVIGQVVTYLAYEATRSGIAVYGVDSATYLRAAQTFPNDLAGRNWNSGLIFILWLGRLAGSPTAVLLLCQFVAVLTAGSMILRVGRHLSTPRLAWAGVVLYLCFPPVAQWTRYVLTDAIFIAGLITLVCIFVDDAPSARKIAMASGITLFLLFLRPNGFLVLPAVLTCVILRNSWRRRFRNATVALVWALVALLALFAGSLQRAYTDDNSFSTAFVRGEVVWNEPSLNLDMPTPEDPVSTNRDIIRYALNHPVAAGQLISARLGLDLIQFRPWYSGTQNAAILGVMIPFLIFTLVGLTKPISPRLRQAFLVFCVPQSLVIAASWASFEGRQGWWILGPSIPLFLLGWHFVHLRVSSRIEKLRGLSNE